MEPERFDLFEVSQLAPGTFIDGVAGLDYVAVPENSVTEIHRHNTSDNLVYIVKGSAEVVLDGDVYEVRPGMRVIIPKAVAHGFRTREERLEFVSIQIPPILDKQNGVFDRDIVG